MDFSVWSEFGVCVCMWSREDLQYTSLLESLDSSGSWGLKIVREDKLMSGIFINPNQDDILPFAGRKASPFFIKLVGLT